jgi:4'-phosphopantetheinyl transferase
VWQVEHQGGLSLQILTPEERIRADRFRFARDRDAFLTTRIILRHLLARYTGIAAQALEFAAGERGKPRAADPKIEFNVSHSGSISLLAFACGAVGVDIELIRPVVDMEAIVSQNFGPRERSQWAGVSVEERERAFFTGWTRKEAYVKALGAGLSLPLGSFDVTITADVTPRFLNVPGWSLYDLDVSGYAAALAVSSTVSAIRAWRLTDPIAELGKSIARP